MELVSHETFYRDGIGRKHFCTWIQHGDEVMDVRDIIVHE